MVPRAVWLLIGLVVAVEPPDGCPSNLWSSPCSNQATCESLAVAGLTCSSVAVIESCKDQCAEPCCITTTSTTKTSTMTSATHTETTYTSTETETHTTTSGTSTQTYTSITTTATTVTETVTGSTVTHTQTTLTTSMTTITETEPVATTSAQGAAAKVTVRMAVKVEKVEENAKGYEGYMEDPRVKQAYLDLMTEVTGLDAEMIDVEMAPTAQEGEITVTYLLTIPYEDKGNGLEPVVSIDSLQSKLHQLNMAGLNEMLDQKMDAAGVTDFSQEVQRVDDDQTTAVDRALRLGMLTSVVLGMILPLLF